MPTQPAIYLKFEPRSASKMRAFKGQFDFNQVCADNSPYFFTSSMQLNAQIVGIKKCNELGRNYNDFASFLASTTFHGNVIIYPNKKSEIALEAVWKKMKTCRWVTQNPNSIIFDEEVEADVVTAATATTTASSNIINKKRTATADAGSEQIEYVTAFAGPQPVPHSKIRIDSIHNLMCLSILLVLYVYY